MRVLPANLMLIMLAVVFSVSAFSRANAQISPGDSIFGTKKILEETQNGGTQIPSIETIKPITSWSECEGSGSGKTYYRVPLGCTTKFGCLENEFTVANVNQCGSSFAVLTPKNHDKFIYEDGGYARSIDQQVRCYRTSYYRANFPRDPSKLPDCLPKEKPMVTMKYQYNADNTVVVTAEYTLEPAEPTPDKSTLQVDKVLRNGISVSSDDLSKRLQPISTTIPYKLTVKGRTISVSATFKPTGDLKNPARHRAEAEYTNIFPFRGERIEILFDYPQKETAYTVTTSPRQIEFGDVLAGETPQRLETALHPVCKNPKARCVLPRMSVFTKKPFEATDPNLSDYKIDGAEDVTVFVSAKDVEKPGKYADTLVIYAINGTVLAKVPISMNVVKEDIVQDISVSVVDTKGERSINKEEEIILTPDNALTLKAKAMLADGSIDRKKIRWSVEIPRALQSAVSARQLGQGMLVLKTNSNQLSKIQSTLNGEKYLVATAKYENSPEKKSIVIQTTIDQPCKEGEITIAYDAAMQSQDLISPSQTNNLTIKKSDPNNSCILETGWINNRPYVNIARTLTRSQGSKKMAVALAQFYLYEEDKGKFSGYTGGALLNVAQDKLKPLLDGKTLRADTLTIAVLNAQGAPRTEKAFPLQPLDEFPKKKLLIEQIAKLVAIELEKVFDKLPKKDVKVDTTKYQMINKELKDALNVVAKLDVESNGSTALTIDFLAAVNSNLQLR
ncbi:hypothetical protein HZA86_04325 [Candidatus Uhrbacteria bacterium]|nr:hypothetical protein [Candidatus Uhrbacteria bacterium]